MPNLNHFVPTVRVQHASASHVFLPRIETGPTSSETPTGVQLHYRPVVEHLAQVRRSMYAALD